MKTQIIILITASMLTYSCNNGKGEEHKHKSEIKLNNGKKWVANSETQEGMKNLKNIMDKRTEDISYDSLVVLMQDQTRYIINNCDMKGEDHDQLHLVLHPILKSIDVLKESDSLEDKEKAIENTKQMLSDYFEYFKSE